MSEGVATYPVGTIAKLLKLTPQRIQQLVKEGVIPRADRGRYELVPAVQGYIDYLRARALGGDMAGEPEHKTRLLKARADLAEMEAGKLAGELLPADQVADAWAAVAARFRQRVLAIPPKAAPLVAVQGDTETCRKLIGTLIHEALEEIATAPVIVVSPEPRSDPGADGEDGGDDPEGAAPAGSPAA